MDRIRVAVVGAGAFGKNHLRVLKGLEGVELAAVADSDPERAASAASEYGCPAFTDPALLAGRADAAVVAVPTVAHAEVGCMLLEAGIDLLVEKPIAADLASARKLAKTAVARGRILQVGHLERFNPAVMAIEKILTVPLFFEVHRLSQFSPRSLDVDVVLDLMIHDIDIVLSMTGCMPEEVRAAGISVLSPKVDIASARLAFPGGAVANLTASRVSTERVRKLRLFQPRQYASLDYSKQEAAVFTVSETNQVGFGRLDVARDEPLKLELSAFAASVRTRKPPRVGGTEAVEALEVALEILARIEEHAQVVARTLAARGSPAQPLERL